MTTLQNSSRLIYNFIYLLFFNINAILGFYSFFTESELQLGL